MSKKHDDIKLSKHFVTINTAVSKDI